MRDWLVLAVLLFVAGWALWVLSIAVSQDAMIGDERERGDYFCARTMELTGQPVSDCWWRD